MYYTMDGSTPNVDSTKYSGEIELSKTKHSKQLVLIMENIVK